MIQSVLPAVYPILKVSYHLDFGQIGLITLTSSLTASLLQPAIGLYTDHRPNPYSLPLGMTFTLAGVLVLALAPNFAAILFSVALLGTGSAVFHPEGSRIARLASGGQYGLAQSLFQVGGNAGGALGPLLATFLVLPGRQRRIGWLSVVALLAMFVLTLVGGWHKRHRQSSAKSGDGIHTPHHGLSQRRVAGALAVLVALIFSKYFYLASLCSYYTFFLISRFHVSLRTSQVYLFLFLGAVAVGTIAGGPIGDRVGRNYVIGCSILCLMQFTLALPYANLYWTGVLSVVIGLVLASAFSAILVYAQDLVPGRVGAISGLFFGLAFGMGGVGAALLGQLADVTSIGFVYRVCSFLPAIGVLAVFLPNLGPARTRE
jgi:MFS transporter, FSR family, fosmidomycin resistance protein